MSDYHVFSVTTIKGGGIIVELKRKEGRPGPTDIAFFDENNNGRLDRYDVKVRFKGRSHGPRCPKGTVYETKKGLEGVDFCFMKVSRKDVAKFGQQVTGAFKTAAKERAMMNKIIKKQSYGNCTADIDKRVELEAQVKFKPPLSLKTKMGPPNKIYTKAQFSNMVDFKPPRLGEGEFKNVIFYSLYLGGRQKIIPTVDPSRCSEVEAEFMTTELRPGKLINISFHNGSFWVGPNFSCLLYGFGLENNSESADVRYMLEGKYENTYFQHLDLN